MEKNGLPKYNILSHTYKQAARLGVQVFPSDKPKYKIKVYDADGLFITYAGASGYSDFPHYIESPGQEYAEKRRQLYKIRHEKKRHVKGSRGYYADQLLW